MAYWQRSYDSGYWELLKSDQQAGRHLVISSVIRRRFPSEVEVLDVGCGYGNVVPCLEGAALRYVGIDPSKAAIHECDRTLAAPPRVSFAKTDFETFETEEKFDVILFNEVFYYFPLKQVPQVLRKADSLLKSPDSLIIVSTTPNPKAQWLRRKFFRRVRPLYHFRLSNLRGGGTWTISAFRAGDLREGGR
jgi:2-polyprenyl-3-methyl-5-hydroxy-6-metoxy-1,4-benzoquinol methylase